MQVYMYIFSLQFFILFSTRRQTLTWKGKDFLRGTNYIRECPNMSYNVPRFLTETSDQSFPITILDFGQSTIIHIVRFYTSDVKTERLSPVFKLYELNDELKDIKKKQCPK